MSSTQEILRLQDLLPASWRMSTAIANRSEQSQVITSTPLLPWANTTQVAINFKLWFQLTVAERDLLFLREVGWRQTSKWFKFGAYQTLAFVAAFGCFTELAQGDPTGTAIGAILTAIAVNQVWRKGRTSQIQLEVDSEALKIAQRRGYNEAAAAKALLEAISNVAKLEGRTILEFNELVRCQNLRAIAGLSKLQI